jgi:hypothetical protein
LEFYTIRLPAQVFRRPSLPPWSTGASPAPYRLGACGSHRSAERSAHRYMSGHADGVKRASMVVADGILSV